MVIFVVISTIEMQNALPYDPSRTEISNPMVLKSSSGDIDISDCKVIIWNVGEQQHSFSMNGCYRERIEDLGAENDSPQAGLEPTAPEYILNALLFELPGTFIFYILSHSFLILRAKPCNHTYVCAYVCA